jgi:hypothetical protein
MAAGVPFSVAAVAAHGTAGLIVGAAVALLSALISALVSSDRVFWLLTLLLLNRQQRWAWAETRSVGSTRRLSEPGRRTVETIARTGAAPPLHPRL